MKTRPSDCKEEEGAIFLICKTCVKKSLKQAINLWSVSKSKYCAVIVLLFTVFIDFFGYYGMTILYTEYEYHIHSSEMWYLQAKS